MGETGLLLVVAFVLAFAAVSRRLESTPLTAPMLFTAFGMLIAEPGLGLLSLEAGDEAVHVLAELTLVLVLFADASRIDLAALRRELGLPVRLLAIGMPLTILLGLGVALVLYDALGLFEALVLAAVLAPTDAALGQAVVSAEAVPARIRQALNVESGLNDGIAVPVVVIAVSLAAGHGEAGAASWAAFALAQVGLGPLAGILGGGLLAAGLGAAFARGTMSEAFARLAGLLLALFCFLLAEAIGGNGFIAAFVGGLTFGATQPRRAEAVHVFLEAEGQALMGVVFLLLGAVLAWPARAHFTAANALYALLSLTLVRMLPVSLSLLGTGLRPASHLFLGWFGPRGLASVIFGLLVVAELDVPHREDIYCSAVLTVLASVLLHGLSAAPLAHRYGAYVARLHAAMPENEEAHAHPTRMG